MGKDALQFDGDVIVVTGAGAGMGRTYAMDLAGRGARIVVNDLGGHPFGTGDPSPELAHGVVEEIQAAGGAAVANVQSVATREGAASVVDDALKTWGRLDAVVSNAGIIRDRLFEDLAPEDFEDVLDVHLRGAFFLLQPAYRLMKEQRYGRIVQVTSAAGLLGTYGMANYAAAKMGLVGLLRVIALEGECHGIRANLVAPGAVGTRMERAQAESRTAAVTGRPTPLAPPDPDGAAGMTPDRVSPIITALAHQTCPYSGEIFSAFGGFFGRFVVATNKGWVAVDEGTSADDLVGHWEEIRDTTTLRDESTEDAFSYSVRIMNDQIAPARRGRSS